MQPWQHCKVSKQRDGRSRETCSLTAARGELGGNVPLWVQKYTALGQLQVRSHLVQGLLLEELLLVVMFLAAAFLYLLC